MENKLMENKLINLMKIFNLRENHTNYLTY
jgi:hypothetical protein